MSSASRRRALSLWARTKVSDLMVAVKIVLFVFLQIVFLPLIIVGFVWVGYRQFFVSRRLGVSATAIDVLTSRWVQHMLGGRDDVYSIELTKHLPNVSHAGMWLGMLGAVISKRLLGYTPEALRAPEIGKERFLNFIYARHLFFDQSFEKNLDDMEQVVLMGAGFDSRSLKYCRKADLAVFELDQTNIQEVKKCALKKAGIDTEFIRFVPVDFHNEKWHERLLARGFDGGKKTLFLWEGVTPYLEDAEVRGSLEMVSQISAAGSVIAFDLYTPKLVDSFRKGAGRVYKMTGESFTFGLDLGDDPEQSVRGFLSDAKLSLGRMQLCGDKVKNKEPFCALVDAVVG